MGRDMSRFKTRLCKDFLNKEVDGCLLKDKCQVFTRVNLTRVPTLFSLICLQCVILTAACSWGEGSADPPGSTHRAVQEEGRYVLKLTCLKV